MYRTKITERDAMVRNRFVRRFGNYRLFMVQHYRGIAWNEVTPARLERTNMVAGNAKPNREALRYWRVLTVDHAV